MTKMTKKSW